MSGLAQQIRIGTAYTRSINLARDADALDLIRAYVPTARAMQTLGQLVDGLGSEPRQRALALIGPFGVGKSAFALFASALLSDPKGASRQTAIEVLRAGAPALAERFRAAPLGERGLLRVAVNGIPDSLVRQLMLALAIGVEQAGLGETLVDEILAAAQPGIPMDQVLSLVRRVQHAWSRVGGAGLLMEIDELGKFLEYESYHPQHREIHLLQLLAEHAREANSAPLHLLVMLHQAFEHYSQRLGKPLRDEWQKVQGRFESVAFIEPAEQSLRVIGTAFERTAPLPPALEQQLDHITSELAATSALPPGLDLGSARALFARCYPLHPLTLLILPTLCQKVAQNERTLFSYLGSGEPFGLRERLGQLAMGDWVGPWDLHFRAYSQEYRVWQGSDFDLAGALGEAAAEQAQLSLVDTLNALAPLKPVVARRETIESGTLRAFRPRTKAAQKPHHFGSRQASS